MDRYIMNIRLAASGLLTACALFLALPGCGGSTSPSPDGGGGGSMTMEQTCTEMHACVNGNCKCSEGPKKDESCCNPDDSSCSNSSTRCDNYCKVCK